MISGIHYELRESLFFRACSGSHSKMSTYTKQANRKHGFLFLGSWGVFSRREVTFHLSTLHGIHVKTGRAMLHQCLIHYVTSQHVCAYFSLSLSEALPC